MGNRLYCILLFLNLMVYVMAYSMSFENTRSERDNESKLPKSDLKTFGNDYEEDYENSFEQEIAELEMEDETVLGL